MMFLAGALILIVGLLVVAMRRPGRPPVVKAATARARRERSVVVPQVSSNLQGLGSVRDPQQ